MKFTQSNLFFLYLIVAPLFYLGFIYDSADLSKRVALQLGLLALISVWLFTNLKKSEALFKGHNLLAVFALICFWSFLSLSWSADHYLGFLQSLHWLGAFLLLVYSIQMLIAGSTLVNLTIYCSWPRRTDVCRSFLRPKPQ